MLGLFGSCAPGHKAFSFCGFSDTFSVCARAAPLARSLGDAQSLCEQPPQGCHSTTYLSASAQPAACLLRLMASFGPVAIKPPELGDLTSKGQDPAGCVLAVSLGVVAGGAAGIVAADNLKAPRGGAAPFVGLTVGALMSALVTTTCARGAPPGPGWPCAASRSAARSACTARRRWGCPRVGKGRPRGTRTRTGITVRMQVRRRELLATVRRRVCCVSWNRRAEDNMT